MRVCRPFEGNSIAIFVIHNFPRQNFVLYVVYYGIPRAKSVRPFVLDAIKISFKPQLYFLEYVLLSFKVFITAC